MKLPTHDEQATLLSLILGMHGQILDGSKSGKEIVYNANVLINEKKVWFGDFRFSYKYKIQELSRLLDCKIQVLREMDCRFDTEDKPRLEKAVFAYDKGKQIV